MVSTYFLFFKIYDMHEKEEAKVGAHRVPVWLIPADETGTGRTRTN